MTASERFRAACNGEMADRKPIVEWAPWWNLTAERWKKEGLPQELDYIGMQEYFGLDIIPQSYFSSVTAETPPPKEYGAGIISNAANYAAIKHTLYPEPKLDADWVKRMKELQRKGTGVMWFTVEGFFWFPRVLFGIENHMFSFYDYPELYHEICHDQTQWIKKVVEYAANVLPFDFMSFAEDMSYNNGPMLSEDMFDEFMAPYYRQLTPLIKKANILPFVDSDGDITKAVGWFEKVGAAGMFPLERQAGVDVSLYLDEHPDMAFFGHFDKMCMKHGEAAMRQEFERLLPSMKRGRFIASVDHQTPPDVSLENYRIYLKLFREYAEKAVRTE